MLVEEDFNVGVVLASKKSKTLNTSVGPEGPFALERLNYIFRRDSRNSQHTVTRESKYIEFKLNFNRGPAIDGYCRTLAAFANADGGYIVFGIGDKPRTLDGMKKPERFEGLDAKDLTDALNRRFSPVILWDMHVHTIGARKFGLIYAYPADMKPVVAISNYGDSIREAEIYYRYGGRTEKIKYPELRVVLDETRRKEQEMWLKHPRRLASVGVQDAAIFHPKDGSVTGSGGTFVIDRELLPKLQFVREGEFRETNGVPIIKVAGTAEVLATGEVRPTRTLVRTRVLRSEQILEAFLHQEVVDEAVLYVKQICYEPSGFLPVYHYLRIAGLARAEAIKLIESVPGNHTAKKQLLNRLRTEDVGLRTIIGEKDTEAALRKRELRQKIKDQDIEDVDSDKDLAYFSEALRSLPPPEIDVSYVLPLLRKSYSKFWNRGGDQRYFLRKAICYADQVLNVPQ